MRLLLKPVAAAILRIERAGVMGCNDRPDTFALGCFETRRCQLKPVFQLSFMLDKLVEFFTCWSHGQSITGKDSSVQQTGRVSVLFCSITTGKPNSGEC